MYIASVVFNSERAVQRRGVKSFLLVLGVGDGYGRGGKAQISAYLNILFVTVSERYLER